MRFFLLKQHNDWLFEQKICQGETLPLFFLLDYLLSIFFSKLSALNTNNTAAIYHCLRLITFGDSLILTSANLFKIDTREFSFSIKRFLAAFLFHISRNFFLKLEITRHALDFSSYR